MITKEKCLILSALRIHVCIYVFVCLTIHLSAQSKKGGFFLETVATPSKQYVIVPSEDCGEGCPKSEICYIHVFSRAAKADSVPFSKGDSDNYVVLNRISPRIEIIKRNIKQIRFKFYPKNDQSLVAKIKAGIKIENCYIERLDLNQFIVSNKSTKYRKVIDCPLVFEGCIINEILVPGKFLTYPELSPRKQDLLDTLVFSDKVAFLSCFLLDRINLRNTVFESSFVISNIYSAAPYNHPINIEHSRFLGEFYFNNYFRDEYEEEDRDSLVMAYKAITNGPKRGNYSKAHFVFSNNYFENKCFIYNGMKYVDVIFDKSVFNTSANFCIYSNPELKPFYFLDTTHEKLEAYINFSENEFSQEIFAQTVQYNLSARQCKFSKLNFENTFLKNCSFENSIIQEELIFFNASKDSITSFGGLTILSSKKILLIVSKLNNDWINFDFPVSALDYFDFPFINTTQKSQFDLGSKQKSVVFYSNLKIQIKEKFSSSKELVEELIDRVNHEQELFDLNYYWTNKLYLSFVWNKILEITVKHGYHGESNFFFTAFATILLFSFLYFFLFPRQIIRYISMISFKSIGKQKFSGKYNLRTFMRCFWVSSMVFANPKMPLIYFQLRNKLFFFIFFEWIIGTFLVILFLVFIVAKYPFVKILFG
ncbi:MAG: hypothetical protein JWQ09_4443 [Segetibacter sp.]|nr:hypothetical protein [Segetibacter sp.]